MKTTQPPVMDVSARTNITGAGKCDKHCASQESVYQQEVECTYLLFRVIPENMFASVSCVFLHCVQLRFHVPAFSCFNASVVALMHVSWWCWTCATFNVSFGCGAACGQAALVWNQWNPEA